MSIFHFPKNFYTFFLTFFDVTENRTYNYIFCVTTYYHDVNDNLTIFVFFDVSFEQNGM